jgi:glyoxylase-like metal-dependent hydrolase (beta-lactamase superfamily II)
MLPLDLDTEEHWTHLNEDIMMTETQPVRNLSRRHFLTTSSLALSAIALNPRRLFSQPFAAQAAEVPAVIAQGRAAGLTAKIATQSLRGGVSVLMGSGGNIAVLPGKDGKVILDSGYATSQPQITAALNSLSADPVTHLINTHWHFDHTDGNEWMNSIGATIIAHDNTKTRLSTTQTIAAFNATLPPLPPRAVPTKTFATKETLKLNGATLALAHYAPAHTDTDISIHFTEADVIHAGDTWFNGFYPFIDYSSGGNINGMIAAAEHTLSMAGAKTIIIPGHGPVGDKAQLTQYREVLVYARDSVAALKKQGKTLAEVVTAKPTAKYDAAWGAGFMNAPTFLGLVYQGV